MPRSDLLVSLVRAGALEDSHAFRKIVEEIAAEERAKHHHAVANRIESELRDALRRDHEPSIRKAKLPFLTEREPCRRLDEVILSAESRRLCSELVEEQARADLLRSHNVEPRSRLLLTGPPGTGKTSLAEALAHELMVPLLVVRYERLVGSYLGETAERLAAVFDYARTRHCVLFFDEFETIGKERGDLHETGEVKRLVSSLLMQVDELPSYVLTVAATNHAELLDRAAWRRFQVTLEMPMPTRAGLEAFFDRFQRRLGMELGVGLRTLAEAARGLSYADAEELGLDIVRQFVLRLPDGRMQDVARDRVKKFKKPLRSK